MAKNPLTKRDKAVIALGVVVILGMVLSQVLQRPIRVYRETKAEVTNARLRLSEARNLQAFIAYQQDEVDQFADALRTGTPNQNLTLTINQVLQQTGLANKAEFQERTTALGRDVQDSLDTVQLNLYGISLQELVDLMHALYARNALLILERLEHLRPGRNDEGLDVLMVLSTVKNA